jgi:hypothetical protein
MARPPGHAPAVSGSPPRFAGFVALAAAACLLFPGTLGCGGSQAGSGLPVLEFSGPAALSVASTSGLLRVDVRWSPAAPTVGLDASELTITDGAGAPVGGLTLTVVPWMPAHGHGTSTMPTVSETSPGVYVATPISFYMPGEWELRTTIAGAIDDMVVPTLDLQ